MTNFISFIVVIAIIMMVLILNTSNTIVSEYKTDQQVNDDTSFPIEKETTRREKIEIRQKKIRERQAQFTKLKKLVDIDIPNNIVAYLQDEVVELKQNMSLKEVDKIWGKPNEVTRKHNKKGSKITWRYGNFWPRKSKLEGLYFYKVAIFKNGKLDWYSKEILVKIKTHNRNDATLDYLDEGPVLKKEMNKKEIYKVLGLPYKIKITCFNNETVREKWIFTIDDKLSYYCKLENNKLKSWDDYE